MNEQTASIEVSTLLARSISLFTSVKSKAAPLCITFGDYIAGVRAGRWGAQAEAVREANARSKEEADKVKVARLPVIKPSGTFRGLCAADLLRHSGILCVDLDNVGSALPETRQRLQALPSVLAMHVSPRGNGLKVFVVVAATNDAEHRACVESVGTDLCSVLPPGVKPDPAPTNVASNCFVSFDPDAWIADTPRTALAPGWSASPKTFSKPTKAREEEEEGRVLSEKSVSDGEQEIPSMSDFRGEELSAKALPFNDEIKRLESNAKTRQRARRALEAMPPRLRAIYRQFIESKPVNRGERHVFLTRVVPSMFEVVAEPVLLDLLRLHHCGQTGTWCMALKGHIEEAEEVLAGYGARYREALGERERTVFYNRLSDAKRRAAFRVCRGLARSAKAKELGWFFLSCRELASRIGSHPDTAHAILCEFKAERLIECVKVGDSLKVPVGEGQRREATTWRWLGDGEYS
jgi:hypothetical protein